MSATTTSFSFKDFMEGVPPGKRRIAAFDFDGSLVHTLQPEEGKEFYQQRTGKPWNIEDRETAVQHGFNPSFRRSGWWGRDETLQPPLFTPTPDKLNPVVAAAFHQAKADPLTYTVILTGRHGKLEGHVQSIMQNYNLEPEEYFLKNHPKLTKQPGYPKSNDTLEYKLWTMQHLMTPEIEEIDMWDDRDDHIPEFVKMGTVLKSKYPNLRQVIIHDAKTGKSLESR